MITHRGQYLLENSDRPNKGKEEDQEARRRYYVRGPRVGSVGKFY